MYLQTRASKRKTLVLDLDETLVHSSLDGTGEPHFTFPVGTHLSPTFANTASICVWLSVCRISQSLLRAMLWLPAPARHCR